jgi:UDP-N-acetylmuramoyl-L-alanyl-D-glutamate--2,6-diaminopimelate ligase
MKLSTLLSGLEIRNPKNVQIRDIQYDSRKVNRGDLFIAHKGRVADGHAFIEGVEKAGAAALLVEREVDTTLPYAVVEDARALMPELAVRFFGDPSRNLRVVGVTGTDGKTTTSLMLVSILGSGSDEVGLISTLEYRAPGIRERGDRTTPESLDVQRYLAKARDQGARYMVVEASSPGLAEGRLKGVDFDVAVFTNFKRDHLDYHGTLGRYLEAKLKLFKELEGEGKWGVVNADDPATNSFLRVTRASTLTYGTRGTPDLLGSIQRSGFDGVDISVTGLYAGTVKLNLCGEFNLGNAMAALGASWALGIPFESCKKGLLGLERIPGRMERLTRPELGFEVFVDYAHTPQGLEVVLKSLKNLTEGRLIAVVGAGGNRDQGKRPQMGSVVSQLADLVVVTSDNPRHEDPDAIIRQILVGARRKPTAISDRAEAIAHALHSAEAGDTVLIAGKGAEDYQEIDGEKHPFDDREVSRKILEDMAG